MAYPLTTIAHEKLRPLLVADCFAIDATVGRGHDTLFLAEAVGDQGRVLGLDIQASAVQATRDRLEHAGLGHRAELIQSSHQELQAILELNPRGPCKAAMFNLGYLPGSDQALRTRAHSTLPALAAAMNSLSPDGILSVICYLAHPGGRSEFEAVSTWMKSTAGSEERIQNPDDSQSPVLILKRKSREI